MFCPLSLPASLSPPPPPPNKNYVGLFYFVFFSKFSERTEVTGVMFTKYACAVLLDYHRKSQIVLKITLLKADLETR